MDELEKIRSHWMQQSFVAATTSQNSDHGEHDYRAQTHQADGEHISSFYASIVSSPHHNTNKTSKMQERMGTRNCTKGPAAAAPESNVGFMYMNSWFRSAEDGDIAGLRAFIERGIVVDTKDSYGWTALMCAACRGSLEVVRYLLDCGADRKATDRLGTSALLLANRNGHSDIARLLLTDKQKECKFEEIPESAGVGSPGFHCDTCHRTFTDGHREVHVSSTVHQFNERRQIRSMTHYHIPESNVGYQIMVKDGWDRDRGLGPFGTGIKFPPKTVLKRDRHGLGGQKTKARITHFGPGDVAAVRRQPPSSNANADRWPTRTGRVVRQERTHREARLRQMEVDLRRQFNELQ